MEKTEKIERMERIAGQMEQVNESIYQCLPYSISSRLITMLKEDQKLVQKWIERAEEEETND